MGIGGINSLLVFHEKSQHWHEREGGRHYIFVCLI